MPAGEAEQISPRKDRLRPFSCGEIACILMKKLVDSIELRLDQGESMHSSSAFLKEC
jgi:hypothetical protein